MFERWYIVDAGAYAFRLYDVKADRMVRFPACYGTHNGAVEAVGKEALGYVYKDQREYRLNYPVADGLLIHDLYPLVKEGFAQIGANEHLLKPSVLVYVPAGLGTEQKEKWTDVLLRAGAKKVKFATMADLYGHGRETMFCIHAGYSSCEFGLFVNGTCTMCRSIPFAGQQVCEAIQMLVASRLNCLITMEDANALMITASSLMTEHKTALLSATGFDRYQNFVKLDVKSSELWPCFAQVEDQIALWAKSLFETVSLSAQQKIASQGVQLSGGLADLYGLSHTVSRALGCPVICSKEPEYGLLKALKEQLR